MVESSGLLNRRTVKSCTESSNLSLSAIPKYAKDLQGFTEADRLVQEVMKYRGYPVSDFDRRVEDISVGHPHLVQNYRAARDLAERLTQYRVEVAEPTDTIGKRIRAAELDKIPFTVVYGDRESDASLAVRERGGEQSTLSLAELLARLEPLLPSDV